MSRSVTAEEVQKIAHLSKLNLEGGELENLTRDFNQILDFVAQIEEVDVQDASAFDHVLGHENVRRPDKPEPSLPVEEVKNIAPDYEAGYIVVPRVIDAE